MKSPFPVELGYRMPAEWHPHSATWLTWPKDPETWPNRVPLVQEIFVKMIEALTPHEIVNVLVDDDQTARTIIERSTVAVRNNLLFHNIKTVDSWIRDYGPNFLVGPNGLGYNDWIFNAWGNKYADLRQDDAIPKLLEPTFKAKRFEPGIVMEGGSIEVNGDGCVLTTEQCLLNPNRNPDLTRSEIEDYLRKFLGVKKVLWLGEGIVGDDTDGHIDDIARFVARDVIVCTVEDDPQDANYKLLRDNLERLKRLTDVHGRAFEIVPLPMPGVVTGASTENRNLERLPASYANFYIANNVVLVPVFGSKNDDAAVGILRRLFPRHTVFAINCEPLVWGMGTIHCVTQQQPAL